MENADRGDSPARARIGSSGSCPCVSTCCRDRLGSCCPERGPEKRIAFLFGGRQRGRGLNEARGIQGCASIVEAASRETVAEKRTTTSSRDRMNVRELERHRRKASSVVWNCALFTERRKKRPRLEGHHRTPLAKAGRSSESDRVSEARSQRRRRAKTPFSKSKRFGRSEFERRETQISSNANSRTESTGAFVRSGWVAKIGRTHRAFEMAQEGDFLGWSRKLA
jgi:hypothetical protein